MTIHASTYLLGGAAPVLALTAMVSGGAGTPGQIEVLHSFAGNPDGEYPSTDLVVDGAGNLYGMSVLGGDYGSGTVFRLSPSDTGWHETILYSFTSGADGGQPYGGVTLDDEGNIYGTAVVGGSGGACVEDGCGVVWKLANIGGAWVQSVIHDFNGAEGYGPGGPVVFDILGNLYGMTPTGGADGLGVVYQVSPDGKGDWSFRVVHTFTGFGDGGAGSAGRLLADGDGSIYGVATIGGNYGYGTVFQLVPGKDGSWTQHTLYSFKGQPDASYPYGGLVRDAAGHFYGTTYYGGAYGIGAVYKLVFANGIWHERVIHSFRGGMDGSFPISHLILDPAGNLYGTTSEGGAPGCSCGTIFMLAPSGVATYHERVVYEFTGVPDGSYSYSGLAADAAGNFYGSTVHGGEHDEGVIYKFTP